jgi:hypothetical protein
LFSNFSNKAATAPEPEDDDPPPGDEGDDDDDEDPKTPKGGKDRAPCDRCRTGGHLCTPQVGVPGATSCAKCHQSRVRCSWTGKSKKPRGKSGESRRDLLLEDQLGNLQAESSRMARELQSVREQLREMREQNREILRLLRESREEGSGGSPSTPRMSRKAKGKQRARDPSEDRSEDEEEEK